MSDVKSSTIMLLHMLRLGYAALEVLLALLRVIPIGAHILAAGGALPTARHTVPHVSLHHAGVARAIADSWLLNIAQATASLKVLIAPWKRSTMDGIILLISSGVTVSLPSTRSASLTSAASFLK